MLSFVLVAMHTLSIQAAPTPSRSVSSRREAARTLIVFSTARSAYSLGHELEFLKLHLQRVATHLEAVPVEQITSNQLAAANHLVVFCPQPEPRLGTNLLAALAVTNRPVLWVGYGVQHLTNLAPFAAQFEPVLTAPSQLALVNYRGREWTLPDDYWVPMRLGAASTAQPILRPTLANDSESLALGWKVGHVTFFSAVPTVGSLSFLFSDLLLDFYDVTNPPTARVFFRIEDYQATSNHREFKRIAGYLAARGHPFLLSVTPSWKNPATGKVEDLDSAPEFVTGLRYAQARGGRIVLRGAVRETTGRGEFWDLELDRPPANENPKTVRERIEKAATLLLKHGLLPIAWQTPDDAASSIAYREIARVFSTAVERPQLSDLTHLEKALLPALTRDRFGRQIVPENLGYVPGGDADGFDAIKNRAEFLTQLRGTAAGCFIHAYQPLEKVTGLISTFEELKTPFLDLAMLDNWVHVPGHVLLTGNAQHPVKLAGGIVTWKAFDRTGRLVASEQEFAVASERTLQRKGKGAIELFEFRESIP